MQKHVLVVDDEVYFRYAASAVLKEKGYKITEATNGEDALEMILCTGKKKKTFDLLMTDILMPGMSGMELIRELRSNNITLPVLVTTGLVEQKLFKGQLRKSCVDYIEKPFNQQEMLKRIGTLLQ